MGGGRHPDCVTDSRFPIPIHGSAWKAGFTAEGTEGAGEGERQGRGVAGGEPEYGGALKGGSPRRREGREERIGIGIGIEIGIGRGPRFAAPCPRGVRPPAWTQAVLRQHTLAMISAPPPAAGRRIFVGDVQGCRDELLSRRRHDCRI